MKLLNRLRRLLGGSRKFSDPNTDDLVVSTDDIGSVGELETNEEYAHYNVMLLRLRGKQELADEMLWLWNNLEKFENEGGSNLSTKDDIEFIADSFLLFGIRYEQEFPEDEDWGENQ